MHLLRADGCPVVMAMAKQLKPGALGSIHFPLFTSKHPTSTVVACIFSEQQTSVTCLMFCTDEQKVPGLKMFAVDLLIA